MRLHTVFITHNRLELTKRALHSYVGRISNWPFTYCVIDNASTDGTAEWVIWWGRFGVKAGILEYRFLPENHYPGYAANLGWSLAPDDATHLQRADNDHIFLSGWCEAVEEAFEKPHVGLVGLRTKEEELNERHNTGGNCVIRRELWDAGLRWDERTWPELRDQIGPGITEDSLMAPAVEKMGYTWTRVRRPCIQPISSEVPETDPDWPYYVQTFRDRGIHKHLTEAE